MCTNSKKPFETVKKLFLSQFRKDSFQKMTILFVFVFTRRSIYAYRSDTNKDREYTTIYCDIEIIITVY